MLESAQPLEPIKEIEDYTSEELCTYFYALIVGTLKQFALSHVSTEVEKIDGFYFICLSDFVFDRNLDEVEFGMKICVPSIVGQDYPRAYLSNSAYYIIKSFAKYSEQKKRGH